MTPAERRPTFHLAGCIAGVVAAAGPAWAQEAAPRLRPLVPDRRTPVVMVVQSAGPAVVNVSTEIAQRPNPFFRGRGPSEDVWRRFFGERPSPTAQSLGSGVIIDAGQGLILTNEHVVARASNITVTLADRRKFEAAVIGADREFDLAVLQVREVRDLPEVALGSSSDLMPGETVVAIGNPFGLSNSVTTGVVSALHRSIEADDRLYEDFVQTDAAINPGNSGGALLNVRGELIGINTAIYGEGRGIGFAIPIDKAKAVVQEVLQYGEVRPVYTGIQVEPRSRPGAKIVAVRADSPGRRAGLRAGDVILDVSGQEVASGAAYRRLERSFVSGQRVRYTVARREPSSRGRSGPPRRLQVDLEVQELDPQLARRMGQAQLGFDVVVSDERLRVSRVNPEGPAARVGIRPGDVLLAAYGRRLRTRDQFDQLCRAVLNEPTIPLVVGRRGRAYYVNLEP